MSYDLKLFSVPEGVEPATAYEQLMHREEGEIVHIDEGVKRPIPDATRAKMQQLAEAVRMNWPPFVQFQPAPPLPRIELNDNDLQIQFAVYDQTASVTMPYFRERIDDQMKCVRRCLQTCREERGYIAFDPQLGRVVTVNDLDLIAQLYRGVDRSLPSLPGHASKVKPWWKFW